MTMKLLITGANGFLGAYVVAEALSRGHSVRAMIRPSVDVTKLPWPANDRLELARADLLSPQGLASSVQGVDCVIHLAAAKTGNAAAQHDGTLVTTENLLNAMSESGVRRLVAISSFSVYDFVKASASVALNEESPLEENPGERDVYAQMKLAQEKLIRERADKDHLDLIVLRPGMIWGKDHLLNAWVGFGIKSRIWVRTGANARIPGTYVENCAQAIVMAAESSRGWSETFNIVDDSLPTQREFLRAALNRVSSRPLVVPVPYTMMRGLAGVSDRINKTVLQGRARVPGILIPRRLLARSRPLEYSNRKIKDVLGWKPRYSLLEGFERSG